MNIVGRIAVNMKPIDQILKAKGLTRGGDVQRYHTANVLRRIVKYMPYRSGATIKLTQAQTHIDTPEIVTDTPYARYLYYGKVMVGKAPKTVTDVDLQYTKDKNPLAGPFWDRRLKAAEIPAMQSELQDYVRRREGR